MERELNEQEINLERENIVVGGMPIENFYTKTEVDELLETKADNNDIPTLTSELTNDSGFIVSETDPIFSNSVAHDITSNDITAWNNKSNFSGSYNDLNDKPTLFSGDYNDLTNKPTIPTVPTNVSSFTNDSGYLVSGDLKTINGNSVVGSGDIVVGSDINYYEWNGVYAGNETMFQEIYDKISNDEPVIVKTTTQMRFDYYVREGISDFVYSKPTFIGTTYGSNNVPILLANVTYNSNSTNQDQEMVYGFGGIYFQLTNGSVSNIQQFSQINYHLPARSMVDNYAKQSSFRFKHVLTTDNTASYTPTADYHPSTKKYVDDSIASAITTTLGGSF